MSETEIAFMSSFIRNMEVSLKATPSIGAGNNGCVLYYIENSKTKVEKRIGFTDLGAEYHARK
jgi:Xaa-Pro aminopeptidase